WRTRAVNSRRQLPRRAKATPGCASIRSRSSGGEASFQAGQLPADSDLVERVRTAHDLAGGGSLDVYGAPYGSDLRLLTGLGGIPSVQYGPGDAKLAHGPFESVPIDQVLITARTLVALIVDICGVA